MAIDQDVIRPSARPLYTMAALFLVGLLSLVAWNIELPYIAFSAGPVADAADSIAAEGVETYPPEGELLMLTIVPQEVNVFEAFIAGIDPTIDLVRRAAVRREGESDEAYRNRVLQQMDQSNYRAVAVALQYLGYELVPTEVVINGLVEGVPAADVLELDDTIVRVEGEEISSREDLTAALEGRQPGDRVTVTVNRDGESREVEVVLAERDDEPGRPMIGIEAGELTEPPFPISIQAGDVGGPSAGMMHTLAIIDVLTEGDLTAGHVVAGTGTIGLDGSVGAIGGIRQKVVAAEAAGAEVILVPQANYESALTAERVDIEIVPVATLSEAVEYLESLGPT